MTRLYLRLVASSKKGMNDVPPPPLGFSISSTSNGPSSAASAKYRSTLLWYSSATAFTSPQNLPSTANVLPDVSTQTAAVAKANTCGSRSSTNTSSDRSLESHSLKSASNSVSSRHRTLRQSTVDCSRVIER